MHNELYAIYGLYAINNKHVANRQYAIYMLTINNVRYAINMQYACIYVDVPIHHKCIKYLGLTEPSPNQCPRHPACQV